MRLIRDFAGRTGWLEKTQSLEMGACKSMGRRPEPRPDDSPRPSDGPSESGSPMCRRGWSKQVEGIHLVDEGKAVRGAIRGFAESGGGLAGGQVGPDLVN